MAWETKLLQLLHTRSVVEVQGVDSYVPNVAHTAVQGAMEVPPRQYEFAGQALHTLLVVEVQAVVW